MNQRFVLLLLFLGLLVVGVGFLVVSRGTPASSSKAAVPSGNAAQGNADATTAEAASQGPTTIRFLAPCTEPCKAPTAYQLVEVDLEGCTQPCYQLQPVSPADCTQPCYRLDDACSGDCEYKVTINASADDWRDALDTGRPGSEYSIKPCTQPCFP